MTTAIMTIDPQLLALQKETITVQALTGRDGDLKPTYGTATTPAARIVEKSSTVQISAGEMIKTTHEIRIAVAIEDTSKVWLPGTSGDANALKPYEIRASAAEDGGNDFWIFKV